MNRESLDRWCERGILGLVLTILVFSPVAFGAARLQEFLLVQALTVGVILLWIARLWLSDRPKLLLPPISWAVLAFLGYAVGRYLTSDTEYVTRQEFLRVLVYAVTFFTVLNHLHRQESTQIIGFTLFAVVTPICFYAAYQFLTATARVWNVTTGYVGRGSGTYICPNHLAGLLELLLPLAIAYVLVGRGKPLTKILIGYSALTMVAGIAVTASRGSWIAVGSALLGLAAVLMLQRSFRWHALILIALLSVGGVVAFKKTDYFKKRIDMTFVGGKVDMNTRAIMWNAAFQMWRDHPWVGVGPGHYDLCFRAYRPNTLQLQPERTHNDYLNTLADWGAIGAALIAATLGLLTYSVVKVWRFVQRGDRDFSSNLSDKFAFVIGASGGILALLIHSTVDFNMQIPANALIAVTLMALLSSHWRFATDRYWMSARIPAKIGVSLLLLTAATYLTWQTTRLGRECLWLNRAAQLADKPVEQNAAFSAAYAIEPSNGSTAQAIGDNYRNLSFEGKGDYADYAAQAITWYQRGMTNNPHNSYNYMHTGMVLDFLQRHTEAEAYFQHADRLDPNGYFTSAHMGRHYVESGEYAAARPWLERSLLLYRKDNDVALENLRIANQRLLEAAQDPLLQKLHEQMRATAN